MVALTSGLTTVAATAAATRTVPPCVSVVDCSASPPCPPGLLVCSDAVLFAVSTWLPAVGASTEVPARAFAWSVWFWVS